MAVTEKEKNVIIGIDPGFDSLKVTTTGSMFKIPKAVAEITGKTNTFLGPRDEDFIQTEFLEGKQHLVGIAAGKYLNESTVDAKSGEEERAIISDSYASFETADMQILIMTGIGMALLNLAKDEKNNSVVYLKDLDSEDGMVCKQINTTLAKIYIGVALPHAAVDQEWGYIESWLKGKHEYSFIVGGTKYYVNIETTNLFPTSQVVVALVGAISDDTGKISLKSDDALLSKEDLPAIVIDGGYLTLGKFLFTSNKNVDGGESNQDYAMRNIHEKAAAVIREKYGREDITARIVKHVLEEDGNIIYYDNDDIGHKLDIKEIVKDEVRTVCEEMIAEFDAKYNRFANIKAILVTGGTGAVYYEIIKELLGTKRSWVKVVLTDYEFEGKKISPEYAISVGMYKAVYHTVSKRK